MKFVRRIVCVVVLFATVAYLATSQVSAQERADAGAYVQPKGVLRDVPEGMFDLILAVTRKRRPSSSYVIALQNADMAYVPLLDLARIVKFRAEPDFEKGVVSGFFISPENTYSIDVVHNTYTVRGDSYDLPAGSAIAIDRGGGLGEFYLSVEVMNKIWPLLLELDQAEMALRITTPRKLPYELEAERRLRQALLMQGGDPDSDDLQGLTYIPNDYQLISKPVLSLTNQVGWINKKSEFSDRLNINGRNDLLYTSADYNASIQYKTGSNIDLQRLRLRLTRRALKGDELPFGLKMLQAGDINFRPPDLIKGVVNGRGVFVSNKPIKKAQDFDLITVEGTGPPGWEIELYRGRQLLDFGNVSKDGTYLFEDVPLSFGNNEIRVVIYGPEGQILEEKQNYRISGSMLSPGDTVFETAMLDNNKDLFMVEEETARPTDGGFFGFKVAHGVNEKATAFATATRMTTTGGVKEYVTAGAELSLPGGVGQVEAYKDLKGGAAIDGRYATHFKRLSLNVRGSMYSDFDSEEVSTSSKQKIYDLEVRARTQLRLPFTNLGLNATVLRTGFDNDTTRTQILTGQNMALGTTRFSNQTRTTYDSGEHISSDGRISANARLGDHFRLRGLLNYGIHPQFEPENVEFELLYNNRNGLTASVDVRQSIDKSGRVIGLHGAYDNGKVINGVDLTWADGNDLSLLWRTSTSFGPFARDGGYTMTSASQPGQAPFAARIFHDKDYDGVFSEGDELLKGVRLHVNGRKTPESDEDGHTRITDAGSIGLVDVYLDRETLDNPFLVSADNGYYTVLRPGTQPYVDMPLIMSGTIDGHVHFADGQPISGIRLLLVDEDGNVVDETTTSFDGFYTFEYVKPGAYEVRAAPDYEFHIPPITVWVASDDLFAYGKDLKVLEQATEAEDVEAAEEAVIRERGRIAQPNHDRADASSQGGGQPAPNSSDDTFDIVANRVRIGEHPGKVRLVMDLSDAADYQVKEEDNGRTVIIDLPNTAWDSLKSWRGAKTPIIDGFKALTLPGGQGTRLQLKARNQMHVSVSGLLPPSLGQPNYRLYIDLVE